MPDIVAGIKNILFTYLIFRIQGVAVAISSRLKPID
jgi:hypothetical protein